MTRSEIIALCEKLDKTLGYPMFQFDEKLVKGEYKPVMTDYVKVFLKEHKLTGWKPYKLWGNGTDIGEQMFFNPSFPNKFFSIASYDDDMKIDAYAIYEGHRRNNELYFYQLAYKYV